MKKHVGTVKELWRYPVKSMAGELIQQADIEKLGLVADRCWAIRDEEKSETSSVRKLPTLLQCKATYDAEPTKGQVEDQVPQVTITLPDGTQFNSLDENKNSLLSHYLNKPVSLWPLQSRRNWRFYRSKSMAGEQALKKQFNTKESLPDMSSVSWLKMLELSIFSTPLGRFYDAYPLHILTSNSLQHLKNIEPKGDFISQRFRPNIFIASAEEKNAFDEFNWTAGLLYIGDTIIKCESKTVRCSMPAQPQVGFGKDKKILRTLEKHTGRHLGINASVIKTGTIRIGDNVLWKAESPFNPKRLIRPFSNKIKNALIQTSLKMIDKIGNK